jgi:uncharacterized cupredoxin-like copper-binding protein
VVAVRIRRIFVGLGALAAGFGTATAVAACGHQAALTDGHRLQVAEMEYRLRPDHISVPGGALTVAVHNYGRVTHNFEVVLPAPVRSVQTTTNGTQTGTTTVAARTPDLQPGQGATITVTLGPGRYGIASVLDEDQGEGMQGSLTVASK